MSRRRNTPEQEIPNARTAPPQTHAQASSPAQAQVLTHEARTPDPSPQRASNLPDPQPQFPPPGTPFPTKAELDEARAVYMRNPGNCPYCGVKIGRGIIGHISKCLRLSKSKTGSTAIS